MIQVAVPWLCYYEYMYLENTNVDVLVNELQNVFSCFSHLGLQEYKKRLYELLRHLVKLPDTSSGIT